MVHLEKLLLFTIENFLNMFNFMKLTLYNFYFLTYICSVKLIGQKTSIKVVTEISIFKFYKSKEMIFRIKFLCHLCSALQHK